MKKYLFVFGTRPEAIKMLPVFKAFKRTNLDTYLCITAQHREMLDQVLDFFQVTADYDLDLMTPGQSLNSLSAKILVEFDEILDVLNPDYVFVHGDTTTSSMCALSSFHKRIEVVHIEAGLRTYNKYSPFPEEINRQITGRISSMHFAPTEWAKENLLREGVQAENIVVSGNTVIDALLEGERILDLGFTNSSLEEIKGLIETIPNYILVTGHRRENFGEGFINVCNALRKVAEDLSIHIIYPVHLNPNVQDPVHQILHEIPNIHLITPVDYPSFLYLMKNSKLILTDSGGVQEEAPSLGKPVLVMRDNTERPEAVNAGTVKLVGTDPSKIFKEISKLLSSSEYYMSMSNAKNPYGDGRASSRILNYFLHEEVISNS